MVAEVAIHIRPDTSGVDVVVRSTILAPQSNLISGQKLIVILNHFLDQLFLNVSEFFYLSTLV